MPRPKLPSITKDNLSIIKEIIMDYSKHDTEAFETRTEMFKLMMVLVEKLEKVMK